MYLDMTKGIETCPLQGKCLTSSVVYKATVNTNVGETRTYTGCMDSTFKKRHYGHVADTKIRSTEIILN